MKKIAIDLDGVVFDSENLFRVYSEMYDLEINSKDTIIDNTQRTFQKRYGWKNEEFKKFYDKYAETILRNCNIMPGADIVLNKLKERFEIIVVTSRDDFETEIAKETLNEIGLGDIQIFNNDHSKIERLIREKVDYVIDDDSQICINASNNNISALYLKNNASNRVEKEGVINVNNWGEIYKYFALNS